MLLKIRVRQSDIDRGVKQNGNRCPVARAVRRATGKQRITVQPNHLIIGGNTSRSLPKFVRRFVERFDAGKSVRPITFCIRGYTQEIK